eukprot:CAMPEP_0115506852 /NCGR_PEP_ID=MMETSP0271-20121206/71401_1 /TAXON_ID=71861 /ORGANISM="Scrippsiella trochoidea, Strain CCMP3099" /LENGTH=144 /DNA_ID=CAMNT_0002936379 /DNA_START=1 /DNA_END=433 /DNA_ORIENTATION=-
MKGIFDASETALGRLEDARGKDPEKLVYYEQRPGGYVMPHNVDNDRCIEFYEECLEDLVENFGMAHAGVAMIAQGLAVLYDTKAGLEKKSAYYERAIEVLGFAQQAMVQQMGPGAMASPHYLELEGRKAKLQRKKEGALQRGSR